jgi:DNA-binding MarR family transcriptional regulator
VQLTDDGQALLRQARPRFRSYAEAVEQRLGDEQIGELRRGLDELRGAMESELSSG